ncbi:hypothetical protein [Pseudonocardia oroxyli]|uniref:hypothetical protein n=1 Tax=Pseudonocardia oroxyli TaxID=366584 RepID=UPI000AC8470E|nr:hypothetical protein [Pseudonocardia oroxyli]
MQATLEASGLDHDPKLITDHSRYAVALHAAPGETARDAITVFDKTVAAHGVPQRPLSDNGLALNPSRRGLVGQLVSQPLAGTLPQIQARIDASHHIDTGSPHQGLPGAPHRRPRGRPPRRPTRPEHAFGQVLVVSDGDQPGDTIIITDLDGEILAERTRPAASATSGTAAHAAAARSTGNRHRGPGSGSEAVVRRVS